MERMVHLAAPQGPGSSYPPQGPGSPYPPQGPGSSYPPQGPGSSYPPQGPGSLYPPQDPGSLYPPQDPGSSYPPQGPGSLYPPQGPGSLYPPQGPGSSYPPQGPGSSYPPQGPGSPYPPQGPGSLYPPQGPGSLYPPQGPGSSYPPQGPGSSYPPQGPGSPYPPQGPGSSYPPQGPGSSYPPQGPGSSYPPQGPGSLYPQTEPLGGAAGGDASLEASGFYGPDTEERDRGEEGGEDQDRRGGEEDWDKDRERRGEEEEEKGGGTSKHGSEFLQVNHTTPDLDALIGYASAPHPSRETPEGPPPPGGPRPAVLEVGAVQRGLWGGQESSGDSIAPLHPTSAVAVATASRGPELGLTGGGIQNPTVPGLDPAPSRGPLQPSVEEEERTGTRTRTRTGTGTRTETGTGTRTETRTRPKTKPGTGTRPADPTGFGLEDKSDFLEEEKRGPMEGEESGLRPTPQPEPGPGGPQQVVCLSWSQLAGGGYVVLNTTRNLDCEEFRALQGGLLLSTLQQEFSPEESWILYLSKPTHQRHQLLLNLASARGVLPTPEVLGMLGRIRRSLEPMGIRGFGPPAPCPPAPTLTLTLTRTDYSRLLLVLLAIGAVCTAIITGGGAYVCWRRGGGKYRAEELHSVENGYHDNPTLDVTNDSQPEMREKPSTNGLAGGAEGGGDNGSRWQVFVNQAATEDEEEEQDTHL